MKAELLNDKNTSFDLLDGNKIPSLAFGTYKVTEGGVDIIQKAIKSGYRHFDTAYLYFSEEVLGQALLNSGLKREEYFVTTKVWKDHLSKENIRKSVNASLRNLKLDYVDLLLIHWPRANADDDQWKEHLVEAWETFMDIKKEGLTKSIGVSNFLPHHFEVIKDLETPVVDQIEFHPGYMQLDALEYCQRNNIVVEAWAPLGRGALLENEVIRKIADNHNVTTSQVILKFCLKNGVLPIAKTSNQERMKQNLDLYSFDLSDIEMKMLSEIEDKTGWSGEHPDTSIPVFNIGAPE